MHTADNWGADLVVVASQGRSAIGRMLLGSVSKQVASEASQSVLVSRHVFDRGTTPVRIIVGVDESDEAAAVVRAVARRDWPTATEVRLIAVDEGVSPGGTAKLVRKAAAWISERNAARVAQLTDRLQGMTATLTGVGLNVSTDILKGSAQQALCDAALQWTADCVFVGAPGVTGGLRRLLEGSVSLALVTRAPCSVEIVRRREP
jgi:nucleotide-binding universal stress UspA family protein